MQETASLPYRRDIKRSSPRFYERYWNVLRQPYVWLFCPVSLGANRLQVFYRIILLLVFLLTASSFVTPRLIGKNLTKWFLTLLEEPVLTVFHWPFGAALAVSQM